MAAVQINGYNLQYVKYKLLDQALTISSYAQICMTAIQQNGLALQYVQHVQHVQYVQHQKLEIPMTASADGDEFVELTYAKICMAAVQQDGNALGYVQYEILDQTHGNELAKRLYTDICMAAVQQDGNALGYVQYEILDQTHGNELAKRLYTDICMAAVQQDAFALQYVPYSHNNYNINTPILTQSEYIEICMVAIQKCSCSLMYVQDATLPKSIYDEMCKISLKGGCICVLDVIEDQTFEMCIIATQANGDALIHVKNQTLEICVTAIANAPWMLEYAQYQTLEMCLTVVAYDPFLLQYAKYQTVEMCIAATECDGRICIYINPELFDIDEYIYMIYGSIFKTKCFNGTNDTVENRLAYLKNHIKKGIINKAIALNARNTKKSV
jgi:hypothetical protein